MSFDPLKLQTSIEELITYHPYWDIINFETARGGYPLTIKTLKNGQKLVIYLDKLVHAGAYLLNRKAALKLVEKALPIKLPVDKYFNRGWELELKFTGLENPRLVQQSDFSSDIKNADKMLNSDKSSFNFIKHYLKAGRLSTQETVIRFIYNLKLYLESHLLENEMDETNAKDLNISSIYTISSLELNMKFSPRHVVIQFNRVLLI